MPQLLADMLVAWAPQIELETIWVTVTVMQLIWQTLIVLWVTSVGACVGSFLNVVIYRLPLGMNLSTPPSSCPRCHHKIRRRHNIPVLGWIMLGGKCFDCKLPISVRYPIVEAMTGGMFAWLSIAWVCFGWDYSPRWWLPSPNTLIVRDVITPFDDVTFWAFLVVPLILAATLHAAAWIDYDGQRQPWKLGILAGFAGLLLPMLWPSLRRVPGIYYLVSQFPETLGNSRGVWEARTAEISASSILMGGVDGLLGALAGYLLAWKIDALWMSAALGQQGLAREVQNYALRRRGLTLLMPLVGLALGWQRVLLAALAVVIVETLVSGYAWLKVAPPGDENAAGATANRTFCLPPAATLIACVLLSIFEFDLLLDLGRWTASIERMLVPLGISSAIGLLALASGHLAAKGYFGAHARSFPLQGLGTLATPSSPLSSQAHDMQPSDNLEAILKSPSYRIAAEDTDFLLRPELRPVRLQLELLKPEMILEEQGVESTIVLFGGTAIVERHHAEERARLARLDLEQDPDNVQLKRKLHRAERVLAKAHYYDDARELARIVSSSCQHESRCDYVVVTGGGPGIMEAANRGAFDVGAKSIGLNITLPHEQTPNAYITPQLCFQFRYFALRKMHFLMRAKALVVFPGGFGTLDELFEVLTLRQTQRMQEIPVILYGRDYWSNVIDFQYLADEGVIADEHLNLIQFAESPNEAWDIITRFNKLRANQHVD
ncbi:conserved hypothetical protein [Pirellula staleyi DSM 6068]|uniref:AMP nucleosidase n=1 Tax=Pirellula staleyi (strain ATCC 27377 / DSM 6068 / ICPB 4128) TaxID=530564 RepID=D2R8B7_PIRSD|nr:TIGR00730 family Rossman fold protein [Pirellula staleyi]ADB15734.1 conserved hypothetical protein [Pirellula staleyi DSM 6068]